MPELLSPAEAALLLKPSSFAGAKCLQAALLTLLGRKRLEIGEAGRIFKQRTLRLRAGDDDELPLHVVAVQRALRSEASGRAMKAQEVVKALQREFGSGYRQYVHDYVAPPLIYRGLLKREDRRFLGIIPFVKYVRTPLGVERAATIERLMGELSGMKRLLSENPARARELALAAGVLLVLSPEARAQVEQLRAMLKRENGGGDGGYYAHGADDEDGGAGWDIGVDVGDFSFTADAFDLMEGISSAPAFTGGDGGGDGSGDGGGGGD